MTISGVVADFTLTNQQKSPVNFYNTLDKTTKGLVIFVYPKANTPGCTKQACGFRDQYDVIKDAGYEVVGLSRDKHSVQASWKKSKSLPYDLLCDENGEVLSELGCVTGTSTARSVFIVDKGTRSLVLDRVKVGPEESVAAVMKIIKGEDGSDSEQGENSVDGDRVESKVVKAKAKPKAKAKASNRGRPPIEKLDLEETSKRVTKRVTTRRAASVDVPSAKATAAVVRTASVKRREPSGGADDSDGMANAPKKPRKAATGGAVADSSAVKASTRNTGTAKPGTTRTSSKSKEKKKDMKEQPSKVKSGKEVVAVGPNKPATSKRGRK